MTTACLLVSLALRILLQLCFLSLIYIDWLKLFAHRSMNHKPLDLRSHRQGPNFSDRLDRISLWRENAAVVGAVGSC